MPSSRAAAAISASEVCAIAISLIRSLIRHHREDPDAAAVAALVAAAAADRLVGLELGADADAGLGERLRRHDRAPLAVGQSLRASRWATTQSTAEAMRKDSMPIFVRRVIAPGASLVCRVVSIMCPVSAASIAIRAVSPSRISPTITMSGSARRIERRPVAKSSPALRLTLIWLMPSELVLDRVLDRDDVLLDLVQLLERRIEGRRLARAGRPGDQHRAVGLAEGALEALARRAVHAQLVERALRVVLVEDADRRPLPALGRQRGHAQVDAAVLDRDADPAVLRHPLLGDVELAHDLDRARPRR